MKNRTQILYVDDEEINLKLFKINFDKSFETITHINVLEALNELDKNAEIGIVISDMKMPVMNGLEFICKAREKFPEIVYIIVTGYEITAEIQQALNKGLIVKYIRKPFSRDNLTSILEDIISKQNNSPDISI